MTKERSSRDFTEGNGVKCVFIRDAPLKVDLFWTHAVIQRVSGRNNKLLKTVRVRLISGWSPNGDTEFEMDANEKVNLVTKRPGGRQKNLNLRRHRRKQQKSFRLPARPTA